MKRASVYSSLLILGSLLIVQAVYAGDNFQVGVTQSSKVRQYFQ